MIVTLEMWKVLDRVMQNGQMEIMQSDNFLSQDFADDYPLEESPKKESKINLPC